MGFSQNSRGGAWGGLDSFHSVTEAVGAVVRRLVGTRDPEYEDLIQSSLLMVVATLSAGRFRGECSDDGWAAVIARNVTVNAIRSRMRERRVFIAVPEQSAEASASEMRDPALGPERLTEIRRRLDRVERALSAVSAEKAHAVYLHDILGYPLTEVAAQMGTSIAAAQSRLVRGRREVLETLGEEP